jgi:hypothetical protein
MFMMELHFVTNSKSDAATRTKEIEAFGRVAASMSDHRVYGSLHHHNYVTQQTPAYSIA